MDPPTRKFGPGAPSYLRFHIPFVAQIQVIPFAVRLAVAFVVMVGASAITILQSPRPDAFRRSPALVSISWWRYPLEWNALKRLPQIECDLNTVFAVPDSDYVWAAGNKGIVVVSTDGGLTWNKRGISESQITSSSSTPLSLLSLEDERLIAIYSLSANECLVLSDRGKTFSTSDGGTTWRAQNISSAPVYLRTPAFLDQWYLSQFPGLSSSRVPSLQTKFSEDPFRASFFIKADRGWVSRSDGLILATTNGGTAWNAQSSGTTSRLNSISFLPDGQNGWIAGNDGLILSTNDGGANWIHQTQGKDVTGRYLRLPAPWYFVVLTLLGLTLIRRKVTLPEESVADVLISDRPLDAPAGDVLSFNPVALGLSRFLRNENTVPPLTIAIIGEWGTGKSSLMNLLRADLRSYKFRPVWFNAWHHQKEEHMLASLLENIKLQAVPRWWTSHGLVFRARLLKIRGWRHWGPLLLLIFFIYVMLMYYLFQHDHRAGFSDLTRVFTAPLSGSGGDLLDSRFVPLIPLLAGLFTIVAAVWRGMTAFGVKPASLLTGISQSVSIRRLEASTSFRQKFAVEFNDVTRALGDRSLLIFVDDLDRCRPENVLETLEAVNFLTTSGECFVVMGMARDYVERCVGRAFKDIAEELIDDMPPNSETPAHGDANEWAKTKRVEFARQYLDKLINIEVRVPKVNKEQSLNLLLASATEIKPAPQSGPWNEIKATSLNLLRRHWRVLLGIILLAALGLGGYFLARVLPKQEFVAPPSTKVEPTPALRLTPTPVPTPVPTSSDIVTSDSLNPYANVTPLPTPDTTSQRGEVAVAPAVFSRFIMPLMALLGLIWLGVVILTRRPEAIVKDSPGFVKALTVWHALIFSRHSTPRSIKRFMNHVRYLAMRQRSLASGPAKSLIARLLSKRGWSDNESSASDASLDTSESRIPDEALVALAAIQHFKQEFMVSDDARKYDTIPEWKPLVDARNAHETEFGDFAQVLQYLDRFLEMSSNVKVR